MPNRTRDVVVVGASAGGVEALRELVGALPADLPGSVFVALHMPAGGISALPAILSRSGPLPAQAARSGDRFERGRIYVAPPDHHLLLDGDDTMVLSRGPAENGHRPAINALFRSAALLGPRAIGVVLSGNLDDGAAGLASIVRRHGRALVQDPEDALYEGMPESAIREVRPHAVLAAAKLGTRLGELVGESITEEAVEPPDAALRYETALARTGNQEMRDAVRRMGTETEFSCPDCGGGLVDVSGDGTAYRCHVGHGWTLDALQEAKGTAVEHALWKALRTLEERATLSGRMQSQAETRGAARLVERHRRDREEASAAATVLRDLLLNASAPPAPDGEPAASAGG